MRALLSFILSTTSFGSSFLAGVAAATEPFNWSPRVDDPSHPPAELVKSMHTAFGYNHCRAVHAKGTILEGEFTPDSKLQMCCVVLCESISAVSQRRTRCPR